MIDEANAQKKYLTGYQAFEQGDFGSAIAFAEQCMALSAQTSYWYSGALGLKCWIANFTNNLADLEQSTATLLAMDTGPDKPWFDAIALFNLGLAQQKQGNTSQARNFFLQAANSYGAQQLHPGQPREWQYVLDYFNTLSTWAAAEEAAVWKEFLGQIRADDNDEPGELLHQLFSSAQLMLRYSEGHDVQQAAVELVKKGISRTFLAMILLE